MPWWNEGDHPNRVTLEQLGRPDARIAAHLDGRVVAGAPGFKLLLEGLAGPP